MVVEQVEQQIKCPRCGGEHIVRHGFVRTTTGRRQRRKCQGCGHTFYADKRDVGRKR